MWSFSVRSLTSFPRTRENEPEGRSFEERPSGDPVAFVKKTLDSRFRGNDENKESGVARFLTLNRCTVQLPR